MAACTRFLQLEVAIPRQCHEDVAENQQEEGVESVHAILKVDLKNKIWKEMPITILMHFLP